MSSPVLTIARYHLRKNIWSRSFLSAVLGVPSLAAVTIGLILLLFSFIETPNIGVVDPGRILQVTTMQEPIFLENPNIIFLSDRSSALNALDSEVVDSVYILPADYPTDRSIELIYYIKPSLTVTKFFNDLMTINLLNAYPEEVIARFLTSPIIIIHSLQTNRVFSSLGPDLGSLLPALLGCLYIMAIYPVSEMLVGALGEERANRTMEIVLTSLKPTELITGKLIAAAGMVLSLLTIWSTMLGLAYVAVMMIWPQSQLTNIQVSLNDLLQIVLLMVTGMLFTSATLIFIGAVLQSEEEVKQVSGLTLMPFMLPIYLTPFLLGNQTSPFGIIMALLPFSSTTIIAIQSAFEAQSWWKILAAAGIQIASAGFFVWLGARAFRYGMLRYGKRIRLSELFQRQTQRKSRRV